MECAFLERELRLGRVSSADLLPWLQLLSTGVTSHLLLSRSLPPSKHQPTRAPVHACMHASVCMHPCPWTHPSMHASTFTHPSMHACIHTHACICVHAPIHLWYASMHSGIHPCICAHTYSPVHPCTHALCIHLVIQKHFSESALGHLCTEHWENGDEIKYSPGDQISK